MRKLTWKKIKGPYEEETTKFRNGREFKIGIADGAVIFSTRSDKILGWILVEKYVYDRYTVRRVKKMVDMIKDDPVLGGKYA